MDRRAAPILGLLALALLGHAPNARAGAAYWQTNADGAWQTAANWSSGALPASTSDVTIDVGGATVRTITHSTGNDTINSLLSQENVTLSGGTLLVVNGATVNGTFTLGGGTLAQTTLTTTKMAVTATSANRLSGVTLNGPLDMSTNSYATTRISSALILNGTGTVGSNAIMSFDGPSQTLSGNGNLFLRGSSYLGDSYHAIAVEGGSQLTVTGSMAVRGYGKVGGRYYTSSGNSTLINQTLMSSDTSSSTLYFDPTTMTNDTAGTLEARNGGLLEVSSSITSFTNAGLIAVYPGSTVSIRSPAWSGTTGRFAVSGGTLNLGGTFTTADLNQPAFQWTSGQVNLTGTLNNAGNDLSLNGIRLANGRINGGTISGTLAGSGGIGVLSGVTVNGTLDMNTDSYARVRVVNNMVFNGTGTVGMYGILEFDSPGQTQTLSGTGNLYLRGGISFGGGDYPQALGVESGTQLTIANGMNVRGYGRVGGAYYNLTGTSTLVNQGLISADVNGYPMYLWATAVINDTTGTIEARNGATVSFYSGKTFTNNGLMAVYPNSTVTVSGTWSGPRGRFNVAGGTLNLGGAFTTADLNQPAFQWTSGQVNLTGTMNNTGSTITLGGMRLSGGAITGGTLAGTLVATGAGRIDGLTVNAPGGLDLVTNDYARLRVSSGLTLNATGTVGTYGALSFDSPVQTLAGNGNLMLRGYAFNTNYTALAIENGCQLTIANGMSVRGQGRVGTPVYSTSGTTTLVNQGLISADLSGNYLNLYPTYFTNDATGTMEARNGGTLAIDSSVRSFTNAGLMAVYAGSTLTLNGTWSGPTGRISVSGGTLNLGGAFTTADLNQPIFQWTAGQVNLTGTMNNTGNTIALSGLRMGGGAILGGTIGGQIVATSSSGRLDAATANAGLDLATVDYSRLRISNGLVLNATTTVGNYSILSFDGPPQTLSGAGPVVLKGSSTIVDSYEAIAVEGGSQLTIAGSMTVRGYGKVGNHYFTSTGTSTLVNRGLISADTSGYGLVFNPTVLTNDTTGTIEARNGGNVDINSSTSIFTNAGLLAVYPNSTLSINAAAWNGTAGRYAMTGGTLNLNGSFTTADINPAAFQYTAGTINIGGTCNNTGNTLTMNGLWLNSGRIIGGTVAGSLAAGSSSTNKLDGVTLGPAASLDLVSVSYAQTRVVNGLTLNGAVSVSGQGKIGFDTNETIGGTGSIVLTGTLGSYSYMPQNFEISNTLTLTVGPGVTVRGYGWAGGSTATTLANQGTISANVNGYTLNVQPNVLTNSGTMKATGGGTLQINANVGSFANSGKMSVDANSTLTLNAASWSGPSGSFLVSGGTLNLGGVFATADLDQPAFQWTGGVVNITGTMNNAGATLSTAGMRLQGGRVAGGIIAAALVGSSNSSSRLDGVTVSPQGSLDLNAIEYAETHVVNGLTLNGSATVNRFGRLVFDTNETLGGSGNIYLGGTYGSYGYTPNNLETASNATLTVTGSVAARGYGWVGGNTNTTILSQGTFSANSTSGSLTLRPTYLANSGTIEARNGATMYVSTNTFTNGPAGVVEAYSTSTVYFNSSQATNQGTVEASPGGTVYIPAASLTNLSGSTLSGGTWRVTGGTMTLSGGTITNNNAQIVLSGAASTFTAITSLNRNSGTFTLRNSRNFTTVGAFTNTGTIDVGPGTKFSTAAGQLLTNSGTLAGDGVIAASVANSGTISPGHSPGLLTIQGNLTQSAASRLLMELGGTTRGVTYDALDVTGSVVLAGQLQVTLADGYHPTLSAEYLLVSGSSVSGWFDSVVFPELTSGWQFRVYQNGPKVYLGVVPEPGTLALLAAGVGALAAWRLRRRRR